MIVEIILSLIMMIALSIAIWSMCALIRSKKLSGTMPKDIQEALKEHKERFPGAHFLGWSILIFCFALFPACYFYAGWDGIKNGFKFWQFFIRFIIMLYLVKAFDIICLDWILITKTHFFQHYFPETEGCKGYNQFGFNKKEQITRIILFPFVALFLSWICTLFI